MPPYRNLECAKLPFYSPQQNCEMFTSHPSFLIIESDLVKRIVLISFAIVKKIVSRRSQNRSINFCMKAV